MRAAVFDCVEQFAEVAARLVAVHPAIFIHRVSL